MNLDNVLNEINVEFGNGQALAVSDGFNNKITHDKTGAQAQKVTKTTDLKSAGPLAQRAAKNVVDYLKGKGLLDKITSKQSFESPDLVFKGDGSCVVNFDDGGSLIVPKTIVSAVPADQQAATKGAFNKIVASCVTDGKKKSCASIKEEVKNYFNY